MSPPYRIRQLKQLELLTSPLRQEIVDTVRAMGSGSAREIARELGTPPDALYYHLRKLVATDLLISLGKRQATRRSEEVYRTPSDSMRIVYDRDDARASAVIRRAFGALLRMALRDFDKGSRVPGARTTGRYRNLAGGRVTAWLSRSELGEVNRHLARVEAIFEKSRRSPGKALHAFSWLLAPLEPKR